MAVRPLRHLHPLRALLLRIRIPLLVLADIADGNLKHDIIRDADDEEQPEQVDALQRGQQAKGDVLADPALVLLGDPVEVEGADGAEFGEGGVEDDEVEVVAAVDPDADEEGEVGDGDAGVEVAADFGGL